jgi:hypothetical protein
MTKEIEIEKHQKFLSELQDVPAIRNSDFSIIIFGQGSQTRSFYRNLKKDSDIKLFWTGWSGPKWMWFISFIPGQAGILELKNIDRLKEVYENVGERSYCGLYFLPKNKATELINSIMSNHWEFQTHEKFEEILKGETDFFTIDTDFDYHGGDRDGEIFHIDLNYGENLNEDIKQILIKIAE